MANEAWGGRVMDWCEELKIRIVSLKTMPEFIFLKEVKSAYQAN